MITPYIVENHTPEWDAQQRKTLADAEKSMIRKAEQIRSKILGRSRDESNADTAREPHPGELDSVWNAPDENDC